MRIWEVARNMAGGPPTGAAGKAEVDVGAPVLDLEWKDDGMHIFGVGCGKTVKLWNLQTNAVQDVGSVRVGWDGAGVTVAVVAVAAGREAHGWCCRCCGVSGVQSWA
jgi:hypothetical protein